MATYKNISEMEQTVEGVGVVQPGALCEILDEDFNNPNFLLVDEQEKDEEDIDTD